MTALLTDNLPMLTGAPNGIKKLRELILELAVRGKLIPQDPSDEPATELLKRIAEEKTRLFAEGKIKKQKSLAELSDEEEPFDLPAGWMWTRLGEICLTQTGTTPSKSQPELFGSDVPFIKPGDIYPDQVDYNGESLSSLGASKSGRIAQAGSLLMVCIGTIGKCNLIDRDCSFNQQINSATLYKGLPQYLKIVARSQYFQAKAWSESSSTTIAILNKGKWEAIPLPLPGIAEQHRLVAKVDELMALCDRLEAQQADAEIAHIQLVQALLDSLTQASDATDLVAHWQRLAEHFHTLFTTEPSIDALKQALLQLAVMGKLVPQDPNDEPASDLLKRIIEGNSRLLAEGKLKKQKPLDEVNQEQSFYLPAGWEWVRLGRLSQIKGGKRLPAGTTFSSKETPHIYIQVTNMKGGTITEHNLKFIDESTQAAIKQYTISKDDLYITIAGTIGDVGVIPDHFDGMNLTENAAKIVFQKIDKHWLKFALSSQFVQRQFSDSTNQLAQPKLALHRIADSILALPPISEQRRIVVKIDQLMALCDQLKTRLIQSRQLNEQLTSTLVEQAVA